MVGTRRSLDSRKAALTGRGRERSGWARGQEESDKERKNGARAKSCERRKGGRPGGELHTRVGYKVSVSAATDGRGSVSGSYHKP